MQNFFLTLPVYYVQIKLHYKNSNTRKSDMEELENTYDMTGRSSSFSQSFHIHPCLSESLFPLFVTPVIFKLCSWLLGSLPLELHIGCTWGSQESCCPPAGKRFALQPTSKEKA